MQASITTVPCSAFLSITIYSYHWYYLVYFLTLIFTFHILLSLIIFPCHLPYFIDTLTYFWINFASRSLATTTNLNEYLPTSSFTFTFLNCSNFVTYWISVYIVHECRFSYFHTTGNVSFKFLLFIFQAISFDASCYISLSHAKFNLTPFIWNFKNLFFRTVSGRSCLPVQYIRTKGNISCTLNSSIYIPNFDATFHCPIALA